MVTPDNRTSKAALALAQLRRMAAGDPKRRSYFYGVEAAELLALIERPVPQASNQPLREALLHWDSLHQPQGMTYSALLTARANALTRLVKAARAALQVETRAPQHHVACVMQVTGGLEGPCDCAPETTAEPETSKKV